MILSPETFNYVGVSGCHCHQFLPSFRKEAFGAGSLLAPDPVCWAMWRQGQSWPAPARSKGCRQWQPHGGTRCAPPAWGANVPPRPKLRFSLGADRLAFFQQEVILKTGRQFFRPSRSPNLEAMSVSHRGSRERAEELLRWRGKWLETTVCVSKASCGDPQTGTRTEGGEEGSRLQWGRRACRGTSHPIGRRGWFCWCSTLTWWLASLLATLTCVPPGAAHLVREQESFPGSASCFGREMWWLCCLAYSEEIRCCG